MCPDKANQLPTPIPSFSVVSAARFRLQAAADAAAPHQRGVVEAEMAAAAAAAAAEAPALRPAPGAHFRLQEPQESRPPRRS